MKPATCFYPVGLFLAAFLSFFVHSCLSGPVVDTRLHVGETTPPPSLEVGLGRCLRDKEAWIAVHGPYEVRAGGQTVTRGEVLPRTGIRAGEGIRFGGELLPWETVSVVPLEDGTLEVEYVRDSRGRPVSPTLVRYHGKLHLHALPEGLLALVNEVDLEEYLKGVVGKEMSLSEGVEALKAQVIAARTYALLEQQSGRLRRGRGERFDLYDDERSQMYGGLERETALAERLVEETRGMFLVYDGQLVRTFYSSSCGGATEPAWMVMGRTLERIPPLGGVTCDYCGRRAGTRWSEPVIVPKRDILEKCLPAELQEACLESVKIMKTLPGGRIQRLTLELRNPDRTVGLHISEFRKPLPQAFRSSLWDRIEDRGDVIAIHGMGYGHGAGLCQVGAYEMAADGASASEILEHYYPEAGVRKLY